MATAVYYTADAEVLPAGMGRWIARGSVKHDGSSVSADFEWFALTAATFDEASATATRMMLDMAAEHIRRVWC